MLHRSDKALLSVASPYKSQPELSLEKTGRDTHCRKPINRMRKARCNGQYPRAHPTETTGEWPALPMAHNASAQT